MARRLAAVLVALAGGEQPAARLARQHLGQLRLAAAGRAIEQDVHAAPRAGQRAAQQIAGEIAFARDMIEILPRQQRACRFAQQRMLDRFQIGMRRAQRPHDGVGHIEIEMARPSGQTVDQAERRQRAARKRRDDLGRLHLAADRHDLLGRQRARLGELAAQLLEGGILRGERHDREQLGIRFRKLQRLRQQRRVGGERAVVRGLRNTQHRAAQFLPRRAGQRVIGLLARALAARAHDVAMTQTEQGLAIANPRVQPAPGIAVRT